MLNAFQLCHISGRRLISKILTSCINTCSTIIGSKSNLSAFKSDRYLHYFMHRHTVGLMHWLYGKYKFRHISLQAEGVHFHVVVGSWCVSLTDNWISSTCTGNKNIKLLLSLDQRKSINILKEQFKTLVSES